MGLIPTNRSCDVAVVARDERHIRRPKRQSHDVVDPEVCSLRMEMKSHMRLLDAAVIAAVGAARHSLLVDIVKALVAHNWIGCAERHHNSVKELCHSSALAVSFRSRGRQHCHSCEVRCRMGLAGAVVDWHRPAADLAEKSWVVEEHRWRL